MSQYLRSLDALITSEEKQNKQEQRQISTRRVTRGDSQSSSKIIHTMNCPRDVNTASLATFGQVGQLTIKSTMSPGTSHPISPQSMTMESPFGRHQENKVEQAKPASKSRGK